MPGEERYEARREAGLCGRCGGELDRIDKNYTYCSKCAAAKAMNTKVNKAVDEAMADAQERVTHRQMAKGMKERVMFEMLKDAVITSTSGIDLSHHIEPRPYATGPGSPETQVLLLSDIQYGRKTPTFNPTVANRRLHYLADKTMRIADLHREAYPINELEIFMLGDMIDNEVLFPTQPHQIEISTFHQIKDLAQESAKMLLNFSDNYKRVNVWAVPGNHGRVSKYHNPVTNWDNLYYMTLDAILKSHPRIEMHIPDSLYDWNRVVNVRGHGFLLVHGDQFRSWLGYPWYGSTRMALQWFTSIPGWEYMVHGHFHTQNLGFDFNDIELIANGTFLSDDELSLRAFGSRGSIKQITFGVNEHHGITWRYGLRLP